MLESLFEYSKITKTSVAKAAGVDDITDGNIVDLANCDSIMGIAVLGEVTAGSVVTLKAYCGDAANLSDGAYKTTTATITAAGNDTDNNMLVLDVIKPGKRYVRFDLVIDTQNAVVDSILAISYNHRNVPVAQGSEIADSAISVN